MEFKKSGKYIKIPFNDLNREVDERLSGADKKRLEGLEGLNRLRRAKAGALKREKKRLDKKLGSRSPRLKKLDLKETFNQRFTQNLELEIQRAGTDVSDFDQNAWNLFGYVRDSHSNPLPNLTVALYDEKGRWLREFGYGGTDKRGFFSIIYPQKGKVKKDISETKKLFVHVTDMSRNVLYKDPDPLFFGIGKVDFREICLSGDTVSSRSPEPGGEDEDLPPDHWVVKGWVSDDAGNAMAGLTVSLYDKDLFFDDYLGTQVTDENGNFMFSYQREGFKDLLEKKPDIYLKVLDKKGKPLFTAKKAVKCGAGRTEVFNIKIEDLGKTKREFPIPPEVKKKK